MSGDFLSRWSRLKDEARRERDAPAVQAAPAPTAEDTAEADQAVLTPGEIAALPKVEDLTAQSDVTAFLRRGVPDALRKAALRRAWMVDPAIRDFVGPARDYDYDWNTPGGAPGYGPLTEDEVVAMARRVLGEPTPEAEPPAPVAATTERPTEQNS
jgi:hypothetical protein